MSTERNSDAERAVGEPSSLSTLQFKTIDGLKIRYAASEAATGHPILLLGTWPESIYTYLPTWDAFAALGSVVAVDLPGFGGSEGRPGVMAPEAMGASSLIFWMRLGFTNPMRWGRISVHHPYFMRRPTTRASSKA